MNGFILMKMITISHQQVYMTLMTFKRCLVQRSRSQETFSKKYVCMTPLSVNVVGSEPPVDCDFI